MNEFVTTYMTTMSHQRETSNEKTQMIKQLQESLNISPRNNWEEKSIEKKPFTEEFKMRSPGSSPLQNALDKEKLFKKI